VEESSSPKRITTSEQIAVHLREAILYGEIPPAPVSARRNSPSGSG
jgi:hypothetical protein